MSHSLTTLLTTFGFAVMLGACAPTPTPVSPTPDTTTSPTIDPTPIPTASPTTSP